MSHDWSHDVKKYVPETDDAAVAGIIKQCGIALHNKDSSLAACQEKAERDRVRDDFLEKSSRSPWATRNSTPRSWTCARK
jgi:hypothetical protein